MGGKQGILENEELLIPSNERGAEGALEHTLNCPIKAQ